MKQGETFEENSLVCLCLAVVETVTSSPATIQMTKVRGYKGTLLKSHQLWVNDILISFWPQMCCKLLQDSIKYLLRMSVHIHGHNTMTANKTWSSTPPRTKLSRHVESQRKHELLKPYFPISTTELSQHPRALMEKE